MKLVANDGRVFDDKDISPVEVALAIAESGEQHWKSCRLGQDTCAALWRLLQRSDPVPSSLTIHLIEDGQADQTRRTPPPSG